MAGIHQTLREARSLYAEALKLQEAVLASHRDLEGCVAQIQTWHESMEALAARVETLTVRLKNLGSGFSSLGVHALHRGRVSGRFSRADDIPARWWMRQIVIQEKKDEDGEKYLTVDSEDDWHEALRRGRWIETPLQLAEQIGVPMNEDVGTLADINAAGAGWGWPPFLSPWGKFGTSYARRVSDDLIEQIKQGVAPENFSSGKKYTGGNSVYLMSRSIQQVFGGDNCWGTYRQIEAAGGHVRKGEKGTRVLFWTQQKARPMTRQYTVFNVQQAGGLDLPPRWGQPPPEWVTHGEAEKVIVASGPTVEHVHGDRAYYRVAEDKVVLPEHHQFPTRNGYYQTALHECAHSTGHPDRMNRETLKEGLANGFGSPEYAREELRAEISAMMTGERVGVGHDPQRGAAYVENWVKLLEEDPHEIPRAAAEAQRMSDYLIGRVRGLPC